MSHKSLLTVFLVLMGRKAAIRLSIYSSGSACLGQDKARTTDSSERVGQLGTVLLPGPSPLTEKCAMLPRP